MGINLLDPPYEVYTSTLSFSFQLRKIRQEKFMQIAQVTQLLSGRTRAQIQVAWLQDGWMRRPGTPPCVRSPHGALAVVAVVVSVNEKSQPCFCNANS